jgi:hypothetical protein
MTLSYSLSARRCFEIDSLTRCAESISFKGPLKRTATKLYIMSSGNVFSSKTDLSVFYTAPGFGDIHFQKLEMLVKDYCSACEAWCYL